MSTRRYDSTEALQFAEPPFGGSGGGATGPTGPTGPTGVIGTIYDADGGSASAPTSLRFEGADVDGPTGGTGNVNLLLLHAPSGSTGIGKNVSYDASDGASGFGGGQARIGGGDGDGGTYFRSLVVAQGGTAVGHGYVYCYSGASFGEAGEALVSGPVGSDGIDASWGGIRVAAEVPFAAPEGYLPFAMDTTAVTGGMYYWNGSAWVKFTVIL
jgi:hypothetical protein